MGKTDLPDLFPGFQSLKIRTQAGELFCRIGGDGPPLLLVHGYPQCHVMWHRIAPELARHFTLVLPDLPGYGKSDIPALSSDHNAYSKRFMAAALIELMYKTGHPRFAVVGHDRGARVTYRMALDRPDCIIRAAVLDILPTYDYWQRMDRTFALKVYHWAFLAQASPFPETLISASAGSFLDHTLASWTASENLDAFAPGALAHYHDFFCQTERIAATCEDYRAGATIDFEHDVADFEAGRKIASPLLALWGQTGIAQAGDTPLKTWRKWADNVQGHGVEGGHFLPEENPDGLLEALLPFLDVG